MAGERTATGSYLATTVRHARARTHHRATPVPCRLAHASPGRDDCFTAGGAVLFGLLAPLAALGLLVIIDESDRIDDWLYLPETLYAFMLIIVISAGAGPYNIETLILGLMNKHIG